MRQMEFRSLYTEVADRPAGRELVWEAVELILGEEIEALEATLREMVGAAHCVAVSDAASGIALALQAAGIGPGDTVMCTLLGCSVPVQGILLARAAPVFADLNPNTYTIDPFCVEYAVGKLVRDNKPVPRALIATDLFGAPCDYSALYDVCSRFGITLIEDMSGAFGAEYSGSRCGNFGRFSVASFAASPPDEMGGGAVFCRDRADWLSLLTLRQAGEQQALETGDQPLPRIGCVDLSVVEAKVELLGEELAARRKVAACYLEALDSRLRTQQLPRGAKSAYSELVAVLPEPADRDRVLAALAAEGIPCAKPGPGKELAYTAWNRVMLVNTHSIGERLISLPIHPYLSAHIVESICDSLLAAAGLN